jgi:hypothetical protein
MTTILKATRIFVIVIQLAMIIVIPAKAQVLKSIVYDFDGLDIGATDLPEGDYVSGDCAGSIAANPLAPNDMLGDRCMKLDLNWNAGTGSFGRGIARFIEFDQNLDMVHFFFYNPASNGQPATFDLLLGDDDNQNKVFEGGSDDTWKKSFSVPAGSGWQLFSVPLKDLTDANPGGNGVFDMAFTGNAGCLLFAELKFYKPNAGGPATYYVDMISFSEGGLPHGPTDFDLPWKNNSDYCSLGAFSNEKIGEYHLTPSKFEALFPKAEGKKIRYVNTFIHWAYDGSTTPSEMPGQSAQILLNNGYTPILTWEPMFAGYDRLDPVQPRLQNIIDGTYNGYIDAFADACNNLSDTIIIRFMHEFEGDWYPWSICKNGNDPSKYATAYRMVVDRFRARGANKVKWMWCVNSDYAPYDYYNWFVKAYPGDTHVNIIASDIYNNHFPVNLPWWRSFRWQMTESYYYLSKYFPNKPLYVCEVGCRERFDTENTQSESKGAWYARMDKEIQSNYHKTRALIFFNAAPDQNWMVNSSPFALQSLTDNIWNDDYYFRKMAAPVAAQQEELTNDFYVYPNPTDGEIAVGYVSGTQRDNFKIRVVNAQGKVMYYQAYNENSPSFSVHIDMSTWPTGVYQIQLTAKGKDEKDFIQCKKIIVL